MTHFVNKKIVAKYTSALDHKERLCIQVLITQRIHSIKTYSVQFLSKQPGPPKRAKKDAQKGKKKVSAEGKKTGGLYSL